MQSGTNFSANFTSIYGDDISFLEKTVQDHPASVLPIFLLLQKYKSAHDPRFDHLIKKGALYFPNQNWLKFQLMQQESEPGNIADSVSSWKLAEVEEDDRVAGDVENKNNTLIFREPSVGLVESLSKNESANELNIESEIIEAVDIHTTPPFPYEVEIEEQKPILETTAEAEPEVTIADPVVSGTDAEIPGSHENATGKVFSKTDTELKVLTVEPAPNTGETKEAENTEEEPPADTLEPDVDNNANGDQNQETNPATDLIEAETSGIEKTELSAFEIANTTESLENTEEKSSPPLPETTGEIKEENTEITFEPLHTMDYFASQGIIIKEEALMNDKLGKQMKSFTDWLKSMKKLHPGKLPEQNEVVEKIIQSSAELSNEDAGVLTEAMAEVLIKQGKRDKAIEMFEKLSLMNPLKSIYFAAKIESLKN